MLTYYNMVLTVTEKTLNHVHVRIKIDTVKNFPICSCSFKATYVNNADILAFFFFLKKLYLWHYKSLVDDISEEVLAMSTDIRQTSST